MRKHAWLLTNLVLLAVTIAAGYAVVVYRQPIQDWWALQSYQAPADIKQIADQDTMIGRGRDLFYVSQPKVEGGDDFNVHCAKAGEKTVVLGCYKAQRIYVFHVADPRLEGVIQVTAAHEMLHAAYERFDAAQKARVDALIQAELPKVTDDRLKSLIDLYNRAEQGQLLNEMHSILGTEYRNLSPELEDYYKQYFSNRAAVVAFADNYQATFVASQKKIADIGAELDSLKAQIDTNTTAISEQKAQIDAEAAELNALRSSDPDAYNKAVPAYNNKVRTYNNLVVATRALIDHYNALVVEHNNEVAAQNSLYHSLDSRYQTVN